MVDVVAAAVRAVAMWLSTPVLPLARKKARSAETSIAGSGICCCLVDFVDCGGWLGEWVMIVEWRICGNGVEERLVDLPRVAIGSIEIDE